MKVSRLSLPPRRRPRRWGWLLFLTLYAILLCRLRLFNLLAFEFAFACALPLSFLGARLGLDALIGGKPPFSAWLSAIRRGSLYSLAPPVPISLNAIWVRNCNWLDGFLFYTLIALLGLWVGAAWGVTLALFKRGLGRFTLLFIGSLLYCLGVFYWTPLIDQFHPLLGYYPGSIYDEEIAIGWRLLISRVEDLTIAATVLTWAAHRVGCAQPLWRRGGMTLFSLMIILLGLWTGVHRSAWSVQRALGGVEESAHFRLYYPAQWSARRRDRMLAELEFNHQELSRFFGRAPEEKIDAYLYPSAQEKKTLIGAGRTLISKPWQRSIHVHGVKVGASVIRHEIAHAFSADWAPAPHHLSITRWGIPHMPMIEGLAVAATWELGRLDPHLWSAATLKIGVAPPLSGLLSSERFYLYSSSLAYTLCGSFVRFYLEEGQKNRDDHSARRAALEALYRSGGESELELEDWLTRWGAFLKSQTLSPQALTWAQGRFSRRSVFYKVCAHEIAERRGAARRAEAKGDWGEAGRLWRSIEGDAPGDLGAWLGLIRTARAERDWALFERLSSALLKAYPQGPASLQVRTWRADRLAEEGEIESARRLYQALLKERFQRAPRRSLSVKLAAIDHPPTRDLVLDYLSQSRGIEARIKATEAILAVSPEWPVGEYLFARAALGASEAETRARGRTLLEGSLPGRLEEPVLRYEVARLAAAEAFRRGDWAEAARRYQSLSTTEGLEIKAGERATLARWARRATSFSHFFETRAAEARSLTL